jgi:hypothetical protein
MTTPTRRTHRVAQLELNAELIDAIAVSFALRGLHHHMLRMRLAAALLEAAVMTGTPSEVEAMRALAARVEALR